MFGRKRAKSPSPAAPASSQHLTGDSARKQLTRQYDALLDKILQLCPPDGRAVAEILAYDAQRRYLVTIAIRPDEAVALPLRLRETKYLAERVVKENRAALVADFANEPQHLKPLIPASQSACILPLVQNNQVVGALNLESPLPHTFDAWQGQTPELLRQYVAEAGAILRSAAATQMLATASDPDQLLDRIREQIFAIVDPNSAEGIYQQILLAAAHLTNYPQAVGAIHLLRNEVGQLSATEGRWAVRVAQLADYSPVTEWEWRNGKSISRRAIETRVAQNVADTMRDPDYKSAGDTGVHASELVVPLLDNTTVLGVMDVYVPTTNAFTADDVTHLSELAEIAVSAIKRAEQSANLQRAKTELAYAKKLQDDINALFATPGADVALARSQILEQILEWANAQTQSGLGGILLAERIGETTELAIQHLRGPWNEKVPKRWDAREGVSGEAFQTRMAKVVADVNDQAQRRDYLPAFEGVRSELAIPLLRGAEALGVLDVESQQPHHYTREHLAWAEFLAQQAVAALTALDLATQRQVEHRLAEVTQAVNEGIVVLRQQDLLTIQAKRGELLQQILDRAVELTQSNFGIIRVKTEAYQPGNYKAPFMVRVVTSPAEWKDKVKLFFPQDVGVTGEVLRTNAARNYGTPPKDYLATVANVDYTPQSILVFPLTNGDTTVGTLTLESSQAYHYTDQLEAVMKQLVTLASSLITTSSLKLNDLQTRLLRTFEQQLIRWNTVDVERFVRLALDSARKVIGLADGWGRLSIIRENDGRYREIKHFAMTFAGDDAPLDERVWTGDPDRDYPIIGSNVLKSVIELQRGILILDTADLPDEQPHLFWPAARSLVSVALLEPLTLTTTAHSHTVSDVFAILTLGNSVPGNINETDRDMLVLFTETLTLGLKNISALQGQADFLNEFRHTVVAALNPLDRTANAVRAQLAVAPLSLREELDILDKRTLLLRSLTNWFFELAAVPREDITSLTAPSALPLADLIFTLAPLLDTLAQSYEHGQRIEWERPASIDGVLMPGYAGSIQAALFEYVRNALKYDKTHNPLVQVYVDARWVTFRVVSHGPQIPKNERELVFVSRYRAANAVGTSGSGIGLAQVSLIAGELGGACEYEAPEGTDLNVFILQTPRVTEGGL